MDELAGFSDEQLQAYCDAMLDGRPEPPPHYRCIYGDADAARRCNIAEWTEYQAELALWEHAHGNR